MSLAAKLLVWGLLAMVTFAALWVARVEIAYRRNVQKLPASFNYHRHVSINLWKT